MSDSGGHTKAADSEFRRIRVDDVALLRPELDLQTRERMVVPVVDPDRQFIRGGLPAEAQHRVEAEEQTCRLRLGRLDDAEATLHRSIEADLDNPIALQRLR